MRLKTERWVTNILFLSLPLILLIVFFVYPMIKTFIISLYRWDGFSVKMFYLGMGNYRYIISDSRFYQSLANNMKWLIFYFFVPNALGLGLALLVDQKIKIKGEKIFNAIFFLPYTITPVAVAAMWRWLYIPRGGLINRMLCVFGLGSLTRVWLGDPNIATYSLILAVLWWTTGFSFILYFSGLRNVPVELIDAARIDGASFLQIFHYITFPMLLPTHIVALAISGINAMRIFDIIYALTRGGPVYSTDVLATYMHSLTFQLFKMGTGSAIAVVLFILSALVILPYIFYTSQRLEGVRQ